MKKIFKVLLTILISFVFLMEPKAYENDDVEMNIKGIDFTRNTPLDGATLDVIGATAEDSDFILMCADSTLLTDNLDQDYDESVIYYSYFRNGKASVDTYGKVAMRSQNVYAAIYRYDNDSRKNVKLSNTVQIERPEFPINRVFNVFFLENISVFPEDFDDLNASKTIHYKVGHVTNTSIIRDVRNGNYNNLYNFAMNDTRPIVTNEMTCTNTCLIPNNLSESDFELNDFYYVYTYRDTENGKYVRSEDVSLYQYLPNQNYVFLSDTGIDDYTWGDIGDDDIDIPSNTPSIKFAENSYTCEEGATINTYVLSTSPFTLTSSDENIATIMMRSNVAGLADNGSLDPSTTMYANQETCPADNDNCYEVVISCVAPGSVRFTATNEEDATTTQEVVVVEELVPVTITYNLEDGAVCKDESKTVDSGNKWGVLCTPTRSGYTFEGWYTQKTGGSKITKNTLATGDITVYARWSKIKNPKTGVIAPIGGLLIMTFASVLTFIILTKKSKQFNS